MPHYATFRAELNYQDEITADEITVIFNGTTYTVPKDPDGLYGLGTLMDRGTTTGDYPFCIARESGTNYVYVNEDVYDNHNPFTIKIVEESVSTTPCFDKARGYSCDEEMATLTEESVTTQQGKDDNFAYGDFAYSQWINAESIRVTFNGTVYECEKTADAYGGNGYGAPYDDSTDNYDWSEYPFSIISWGVQGSYTLSFTTQTAGTYAVKIEAVETIVTTTPCFDLARGYSCDAKQMVIEESVTTQGDDVTGYFSDGSLIDAETIKVTFNGTEYECEQSTLDGDYIYGGFSLTPSPHPDFSQYPFVIMSRSGDGNFLTTETAGTYSVKVEWTEETITTTPCFKKAVKSIGGDVVYAEIERTEDEDGCYIYTLNITDADLAQIIHNGQQLVILEPMSKGGSTNYAMHYPTLVWANGASPTEVLRIDVGGLGDPVAMVTITVVDPFTLNEHLLTLFAYSGTLSPRYLEGKICVSRDPLIVPLDKDISAATASSPVKSTGTGAYNRIMNALNNGVPVYLWEYNSNERLLVTAFNKGSGMSDATITVNVETYNSSLNVTYSMPATFCFDQNGCCYYPPSGSIT